MFYNSVQSVFPTICLPKFYSFVTFAPFEANTYWPQKAQKSQKKALNNNPTVFAAICPVMFYCFVTFSPFAVNKY